MDPRDVRIREIDADIRAIEHEGVGAPLSIELLEMGQIRRVDPDEIVFVRALNGLDARNDAIASRLKSLY